MPPPLAPGSVVRSPGKAALLAAAGLLVLWGVVTAINDQTSRMELAVNDISELRDPSPFRVALLGHLDKIHLSALAFLRSPDAALPAQVTQSEKEFENSLREFEKQNPRLFPPKAGEEIRDVFTLLKSAVSDTMKYSADRAQRRAIWEANFAQGLSLIDHRIRPLTKKGGEERLEALLKVENQFRAWEQSLEQSWTEPTAAGQAIVSENESKGESLLELYEQEGLVPGERSSFRALKSLWSANSDLARQGFALGAVQTDALNRMNTGHKRVQETLAHALPLMPPEELEHKKTALLRSMRLHLILAGVFALAGVLVLLGTAIGVWRLGSGRALPPEAPPAAKPEAPPEPPIMEMDLKGQITSWSKAAKTLYGYDAIEMSGQSISFLFASESEIARLYSQMKASPHLSFETQHRAKSGVIFPVKMDFRPVTADGHVKAIGLICHRR